MTDLDAAIEANEICVLWFGGCWVWCCRRHGNDAAWLGKHPADDPDGRAEVAEHLAEHVAFDNQPREIARRALVELFSSPRFWSEQDRADAAIDAVWDTLTRPDESAAEAITGPTVGDVPDSIVQAVLSHAWRFNYTRDTNTVRALWNKAIAVDLARAVIEAWEAHSNAEHARQAAEEWGDPRFLPADPTAAGL